MEYLVDSERLEEYKGSSTGIYVRAKTSKGTSWDNTDILFLTKESLFNWLRSRGGSNEWAENCVALLLGHDLTE